MTKRILYVILATSLLLFIFCMSSYANPPDPNSLDGQMLSGHEAWMKQQIRPEYNTSCCDISDGRVAELRPNPNGNTKYQVKYSKEHWANGTDEWIDVPDNTILKQRSPLIVPIVWIYAGKVLCVALAAND